MVSAVIEGLKAERPELRIELAAWHPEIFLHNPHVSEVVRIERFRRDPARMAEYLHVRPRPAEERHLQVSGHLIQDMYGRLGIPLAHRPRQPRIYLTERELRFRERCLERLPRPRIAIVPHGLRGVMLPNKIYPADQWRELAGLLMAAFPAVLQLGSKKDGPLLRGAIDLRDIGYRHTASVLCRCDLLVTPVGGLMHLAAAVRAPTVVLYGAAEHPAISGYPWNRNLYVPIDCGPCWMAKECSHHTCMRRLTPDVVLHEVHRALEERRDQGQYQERRNAALQEGPVSLASRPL